MTYDLMLQMIMRYFAFGHETDEQLQTLAHASVWLMFGVIKPLGLLLARLPVGPDRPGETAGASFQLAYRSNFLIPHRRAAWIRFRERLSETAEFTEGVNAPLDTQAILNEVGERLRDVGRSLGAHIEAV
ncbi:MAG: hypothetical protein M3144_06215 [Actinomycetota bacterium]|nr:hypothetical protein [Actinomycetota bacterium]